MMSKTFKGANVFMSRNLVPPEIFDSLHDALKHNGAEINLCCDPSRNGPNDFHIISSYDHEKFDILQTKGCNLLGPQCVLSCAKECRSLPKQGYTCCLAMDGVKVLASGFEMDEKLEIGKMVTAMGGVLHTKASSDVSFVIARNVLAAKYKWAANVLKKPIVSLNWLRQCWKEHRVVPHESYKVLPFSGLTICVTRIPADERKDMQTVVVQNGGKYSAELTKKCTHLVCDISDHAPEGDKYKVAKKWGNIHVITRKWFDQSVARRVCLKEDLYTVQGGSASSVNGTRTCLLVQRIQDKGVRNSQCAPSSVAGDSNLEAVLCAGIEDPDLETTLSQNMSATFLDMSVLAMEESGTPAEQPQSDTNIESCVAVDSQNEDNDLYLADCRILLVGFDASEMRKLVNMVRRGGGSRYMSFNEKLTHIVVGTPSESEKKDVRGLGALGVIYVVRTIWLEDCDHEKKEIPVLRRHIAYDTLLPKDPVCSNNGATMGMNALKEGKASTVQSILLDDQFWGATNSASGVPLVKNKESEVNLNGVSSLIATVGSVKQSEFCTLLGLDKDRQTTQPQTCNVIQDVKSSRLFKGRLFKFSSSFPQNRRAEIIEWVNQGGGTVVDEQTDQNVHFTVQCHGVVPVPNHLSSTTHVSSHWIRSSLEDRCLLAVDSHILYSPLPCQVPLPVFETFRFCVSQYDERERLLLRNLCFTLGAKFGEKLTKKVTHLLCKFANGPKYEAACKWGIQSVTCEWIYECVKKNDVVALGPFCPKEVSSQDREAGLCTMSQHPTQATRMISGDNASQFPIESEDLRSIQAEAIGRSRRCRKVARVSTNSCDWPRVLEDGIDKGQLSSGLNHSDLISRMTSTNNNTLQNSEEVSHASNSCKRPRFLVDDIDKGQLSSGLDRSDLISRMTSSDNNTLQYSGEVSRAVPDVAAAIEDLLAQTTKIHDLKAPGIDHDKNLFSDCLILGKDHADPHSAFGLSEHWINRTDKNDDTYNPSGAVNVGMYDGFSETQTDSQVVGYEEDLSGRQMIIDRVRTRSSLT